MTFHVGKLINVVQDKTTIQSQHVGGRRRGSCASLASEATSAVALVCGAGPCPCRLIGKAACGAAHCMVGLALCGPQMEHFMANDDMIIDRAL
jgi:hypothetical protein